MEDRKTPNSTLEHEKRDHPRYSLEEDCILELSGLEAPVRCSVIDLSQEGCRVRTPDRLAVRSGWPADLLFKVSGVEFKLSGVLQWTDGRNLLGIRFVNVIPRRMLDLAEVLCHLEAARAAATRKPATVPAQPLPNPSAARPAALNPPATEPAGRGQENGPAAPQPSPSDAASTPSQAPGNPARERRANTRHEVDNFATIYLVNVASTLRGRIADLSLTGCRIHTEDRFPVGIYTRVETEFHLEGLPFRLGGVVQSIHDRKTVGIRFLDLSERKRQQVIDLIAEISEARAVTAATS